MRQSRDVMLAALQSKADQIQECQQQILRRCTLLAMIKEAIWQPPLGLLAKAMIQ
jgi:hypothetical protein